MVRGEVFRLRSPRGRRFEIDGRSTRVLIEQTTAVITDRLGESASRLDANELGEVDAALAVVFGL